MFIDRSYFIGELNIPGTNKVDIAERLDLFIEIHETFLLKDVFGFQFYRAFMDGLHGSPVAQAWTDLLQGTAYTDYNGRQQEWVGLVSQPLELLNAIDASNTIMVVVGRGGTYDPVAGTSSVLLPSSLVGKDFIIEQRAYGQLSTDEYGFTTTVLPNDTLQLPVGKIFSNGDKYFYKATTIALNTTTGTAKKSLIANYIYYQWMKDQFTQTVGLGEVATKAENAKVVSPFGKMMRAQHEMVERIRELMYYLQVRQTDYPDWWTTQAQYVLRKYRYQNEFGI